MSDVNEFLDRVFEHVGGLERDRFNYQTWRFAGRPTGEGVGLMPSLEVDPETMVSRVLDVEGYPENVNYVKEIVVTDRRSDRDFTYVQKMELPVLGGLQTSLSLADHGERDGFRVVAWTQNDAGTDALDKKRGGARTEYNLGAWLIKSNEVAYALSSAPRKKDVGSLKFAVMTKGADATAPSVLRSNIEGMVAWAQRS